jgi:hypothetical protein
MKPLFNLPEKYSQGFQIDMSLLNEEQRNHVLQMFDARGLKLPIDYIPYRGDFFLSYSNNSIGYSSVSYPTSILNENLPLITYPELCRGAVQLENYCFCIADSPQSNTIMQYADMLGIYEREIGRPCGYLSYADDTVIFCEFCQEECTEISPDEFEAKLRGIFPVVRETTEKQSADNAQCKRYLKSTDNECVVEFIEGTIEDRFKGRVIERGQGKLSKGYVYDGFFCDQFEPCDYTPAVEVSPEVEQPKETISDCGKKTLMDNPTIADHIGSHFNLAFDYAKALVNENTSLRQENAQLKDKLNFANPQLLSLTQANTDLTKQVEELTQQVFDLKRLLRNYL